ncbi:MAG: glucose-6-phosphate dehydrogenase assembly protein OpcA [Solirubrobacteraceae bacterium]|jgi:glucose-6-phosphate dehydrogenase assembly protein OpcA
MAGGDLLSGRSDAVWSEQGTTPDAIEAALRKLLVEVHTENDDFLPARVLNMIAFVDREWTGEIANRLRGVGRYHASRLVVLAYEPRRERLDARVMIASEGASAPGELALLHETVVVELGDRHLDDLLTIADPLVVTDLPTLLWSPHGHHEIVAELLALSQAVLLDSVDEPVAREALDRACELSKQAYVVDLAWLRSTPWRERVAATFDPVLLRRELSEISSVTVRHHPASTAAATLLVGWLASRLGWRTETLESDGDALVGTTHGSDQDVAVRLEAAPELQVPGLEDLALETASGLRLRLSRGAGGLRAQRRWPISDDRPDGEEREWTLMGASRGETGVLGEGIRQALLRDPTYVPALKAARAMLS